MNYKKEQEKFDLEKWSASQSAKADLCGTYEFCGKCNRDEEYPCAKAKRRFEGVNVRVATARKKK